jgi:hypothetical protein
LRRSWSTRDKITDGLQNGCTRFVGFALISLALSLTTWIPVVGHLKNSSMKGSPPPTLAAMVDVTRDLSDGVQPSAARQQRST